MTEPGTGDAPRDPENSKQRAALLLAVALILVWGINFSVLKAVLIALTPSGFLFIRYLIMPLCAAALLWQRYGRRWPRLPRAELWALLRLGLLGHLLHVGLVTFGIHWSTAFSSSLILACGPVFTLLLLRGLGIERLTRAQIVGVAIACIGVLIFLSDKLLGAQWQGQRRRSLVAVGCVLLFRLHSSCQAADRAPRRGARHGLRDANGQHPDGAAQPARWP